MTSALEREPRPKAPDRPEGPGVENDVLAAAVPPVSLRANPTAASLEAFADVTPDTEDGLRLKVLERPNLLTVEEQGLDAALEASPASPRVSVNTFADAIAAVAALVPDVDRGQAAEEMVLNFVEREKDDDDDDAASTVSSNSHVHDDPLAPEPVATSIDGNLSVEPPAPIELRRLPTKMALPRGITRGATRGALAQPPPSRGAAAENTNDAMQLTRTERVLAALWSALAHLYALLLFAVRELLYLLLILAPSVVAFIAHRDEPLRPQWQIWLLRPLYALVIGRAVGASLFAILGLPAIVEALPPRALVVIEAFRGWKATTIWGMCLNFAFSVSPVHYGTERAAWRALWDIRWLVGINAWLFALALSRGLLDAAAEASFVATRDAHFQTRVQAALLRMRCIRILFATGRAARERRAREQRTPTASPLQHLRFGQATNGGRLAAAGAAAGRALGKGAHAGAHALGAGVRRVGGAAHDLGALSHAILHKRRMQREAANAKRQPAAAAAAAAAAGGTNGSMRKKRGGKGGGTPADEATSSEPLEGELFVVDDNAFLSIDFDSITEQLALVRAALSRSRSGHFASSLGQARRRAEGAFAALLGEYERERERARAREAEAERASAAHAQREAQDVAPEVGSHGDTAQAAASASAAPPAGTSADGFSPPETIPRARLVRWCVLASRKRGAAAIAKVRAELEALWPAEHIDKTEFVSSIEVVFREQRFVQAAVASLGNLHKMMHAFLIGGWAFVVGLVAVFLVDWGFPLDGWLVPLSSGMLSIVVLSGRVPYETLAGIAFVVLDRPYGTRTPSPCSRAGAAAHLSRPAPPRRPSTRRHRRPDLHHGRGANEQGLRGANRATHRRALDDLHRPDLDRAAHHPELHDAQHGHHQPRSI